MFPVTRPVCMLSEDEGDAIVKRYAKLSTAKELGVEEFLYMYTELYTLLRIRALTVRVDEQVSRTLKRQILNPGPGALAGL